MRKLLPLLLALVLPLAACGDDGPTDSSQALVGNYTLVQVNGSNLPALLGEFAEGRVDVMSGTLTLRNDRTYTGTSTIRITPPGGAVQTIPVTENGTYTATGSTVQLQSIDGEVYSGTLSGNTLSVNLEVGLNFTYQKQ